MLGWGDPQPRVWWSKVEARSLVSLVTRGDPALLSLRGLAREDTGEFVCQARNSIGTAEASIHLHVHCE